jgi:soluble lytic murein transglycosylase
LAGVVLQLLSEPEQLIADRWLLVHKDPLIIQGNEFLSGNELQGRIFAHGVDRLAKSDLNTAILIWDSKKAGFATDNETVQKLERKLALALAYDRDARAYDRLKSLKTKDTDVREWTLRAALFEQNWQYVAETLAGSTPEEQKTPHWQYWQARSLMATGNIVLGQVVYNQLAEDRSYYGFIAADQVNKPYAFSNNPVNMDGNELQSLAETPDFKVVKEFKLLGRDTEAKRHWAFIIKKLSKDQLKIFAKLAQQWQWYQLAIITLVKADYWDDLEIRFPLSYLQQVQVNAEWQALNPAVIFGLIRQESMLDEHARSAVGALGLMQIMPETGKQIARNLNEPWQSDNALLQPDINIKYGAFYYKQLLGQFDGHFALATAAYNAGPNKVVKWLPSQGSIPADIWIETIPYKETRKYVMSVLSYATIYQQRMLKETLKITGFLLDVRSR